MLRCARRTASRLSAVPCAVVRPNSLRAVKLSVHAKMTSESKAASDDLVCLDAFATRQFTDKKNPSFIEFPMDKFAAKVNDYVREQRKAGVKDETLLAAGYAPFCKHIFMPNFADALCGYAEITAENEHLLRSSYVARTEQELPVLTRYFPRAGKDALKPPVAKYLDVILYSREQITIENKAMGNTCTDTAPWGIISIKPQNEAHETPMPPITMMRNALGVKEGGSGVPLDHDAYKASVAFWAKHASFS